MRIGINAQIVRDGGAGVARYAANVVQALADIRSHHSLTVFSGSPAVSGRFPGVSLSKTGGWINSPAKRILWEQCVLPFKTGIRDLDLMYYPDHTAPLLLKSSRVVLTVHDLAPLAVPHTHSRGRRLYKSSTLRRSVARADKVIVISHSTFRECLHYLDEPANKFSVVYPGVDPSIQRVTDRREIGRLKKSLGLGGPFVLYVGTLESRKNVVRLIQAFDAMISRSRLPHRIVLVGGPGHGYEEIQRAFQKAENRDRILFTGYVGTGMLPLLYSSASLFVYPSLYEGFGLPPLEAMACGCPVVASNSTSLPEAVGDAGLLPDPLDVDDIAGSMKAVLTNKRLAGKLVKKGFDRVKMFTWDRAAANIMKIFEELGSSGAA